jgi:ABC-type transport system substrate-binding protein
LRDGLMFHNGEKVLARDCAASINRWGARDAFGQALMQRTDEMSAPDDKTIVFRLKQPFALLPDALCHGASNMCAMMPQHIAETDPFKQFTEVVGSGPFRFKADERVQGSLFVYERFAGYKPREGGESSFTAGPKIVHFDRVEWHVQPEPATKAAALQAGEMDWWENPTADLLPLLRKNNIATPVIDPTGTPLLLRPNRLHPPFDKPAVRRALMGAIDQEEFMIATMGEDTSLWSVPAGFFPPISPLASNAGMSALTGKRDYAAVKKALAAAGYQGEKVVLMVGTDQPNLNALSNVAAEMLKRVGMNVDYQATDWAWWCSGARSPSRRLRAAGTYSAPASPGSISSRRRATCRCAAMARVPGSAGPMIRRSRNCGTHGSTPQTPRRRRRSAWKSNFRRSRACRIIRSGWHNCRRRSAMTSPACRRASRSSGTCAAPEIASSPRLNGGSRVAPPYRVRPQAQKIGRGGAR